MPHTEKHRRFPTPVPTPTSGNIPKNRGVTKREPSEKPTVFLGAGGKPIPDPTIVPPSEQELAASAEQIRRREEGEAAERAKLVAEEDEKKRSLFEIAKDLTFGNVIEKDPISGETRIDPKTGEPVESKLGILPITGVGPGAALALPGRITSVASKSRKVFNLLKSKTSLKIIKWTGFAYVLATDRKLATIDTTLSQMRENMPIVLTNVALGAWTPEEGFARIDELEEDILEKEKEAKIADNWSPVSKLTGRLDPINQRVQKLKDVLPGMRQGVAKIEALQAAGVKLSPEELDALVTSLENQLKGFGKPGGFFGFK